MKVVTRNTLDCGQSNVNSSRDIFSSISPNLPLCSFSLCFSRLVTLSCEISDNLLSHATTVITESEGKVIVNPKMRLKDMAIWIYKMAAKYNWKWRCLIHRPRKPHPRNEHEVSRTTHRWDMAIWSLPICVNRPEVSWSVVPSSVGRQYSYFLHWSHIYLIRYVRNVVREE